MTTFDNAAWTTFVEHSQCVQEESQYMQQNIHTMNSISYHGNNHSVKLSFFVAVHTDFNTYSNISSLNFLKGTITYTNHIFSWMISKNFLLYLGTVIKKKINSKIIKRQKNYFHFSFVWPHWNVHDFKSLTKKKK